MDNMCKKNKDKTFSKSELRILYELLKDWDNIYAKILVIYVLKKIKTSKRLEENLLDENIIETVSYDEYVQLTADAANMSYDEFVQLTADADNISYDEFIQIIAHDNNLLTFALTVHYLMNTFLLLQLSSNDKMSNLVYKEVALYTKFTFYKNENIVQFTFNSKTIESIFNILSNKCEV